MIDPLPTLTAYVLDTDLAAYATARRVALRIALLYRRQGLRAHVRNQLRRVRALRRECLRVTGVWL